MSTSDEKNIFFGTRGFKEKYSTGYSTQALWRQKGMPYYRVPNSQKIIYKDEEVLAWITSQRISHTSELQDSTLKTDARKEDLL